LASHEPDEVADVVASLAVELSASVPAVIAVGVGLGGLVDDHSAVVRAPFLGWGRVPLGRMLRERTGLPTVVDNDLVAHRGRALVRRRAWADAAVLTVGAGVGYGVVIHDRIVLSEDSGVGLVGHWPLQHFGPLCPDGHRGCAQALLAVPSIVKSVSTVLDRPLTYDGCLDLAEAGDPAARRIIDEAGRGLGRLIAAVGNLTVPQLIVLGGEGVRLARVAAAAVDEGVRQDRDPRAAPLDIHILAATRPNGAGAPPFWRSRPTSWVNRASGRRRGGARAEGWRRVLRISFLTNAINVGLTPRHDTVGDVLSRRRRDRGEHLHDGADQGTDRQV
jgi:predicted NBD/HSP70 family sugar kinase